MNAKFLLLSGALSALVMSGNAIADAPLPYACYCNSSAWVNQGSNVYSCTDSTATYTAFFSAAGTGGFNSSVCSGGPNYSLTFVKNAILSNPGQNNNNCFNHANANNVLLSFQNLTQQTYSIPQPSCVPPPPPPACSSGAWAQNSDGSVFSCTLSSGGTANCQNAQQSMGYNMLEMLLPDSGGQSCNNIIPSLPTNPSNSSCSQCLTAIGVQ